MGTASSRRILALEDEVQRLRSLLRILNKAAGTPAGDFYIVPVIEFDAVMREAGLRPDPHKAIDAATRT